MQIIQKIVVAFAAVCFVMSAAAQVQQARGKATVTYTEKTLGAETKAKAVLAAQLKAVEFYYAEAGESEASNFDAIRDKLAANPDRFILDTTILSEDDVTATKQYTVAVRVQLNVANLRNEIRAGSAIARAGRTERSALAFLFVSRETEAIRSFDTRVATRSDESAQVEATASTSQKGTEGERIRRGQISTNASTNAVSRGSVSSSVSTETGGTQVRRATETAWRLFPSANLNQIFSQIFTRAGFKVNEASFIEPYSGGRFSVAMVENDYRTGNDMKASTLQNVAAGMKNAQIPFVAIGTLDVGLSDTDRATGGRRVTITVNARILDVTQPIPDTVASVGPVQYAGVGSTEEEARANGLRLAANNAARDLTSQLTNLGLK